jgi:hypothetical protein
MKSPNDADSETLRDRLIALSRRREQVKDANRRPRLHRLTAAHILFEFITWDREVSDLYEMWKQ